MNKAAVTVARQRRVKRVSVTPELILELLKLGDEGTVVDGGLVTFVSDPIPESATALRCGLDNCGNVQLLLEDDSFPPVFEGCIIPQITPTYKVTQ